MSRQIVLFAVERRKEWRMLQSKAGVTNKNYLKKKAMLARLDRRELTVADPRAGLAALLAGAGA